MKFLRCFWYALRGIGFCIKEERNFRIHVTAVVTVLIFSWLYGLPKIQYPSLILILILVPALEAVNSAVERVVDLASPNRNPLARVAKDAASGAVLLAAVGSVAMACFFFSDPDRLMAVWDKLKTAPMLLALAVYALAGALFVCLPGRKNKSK